MISKTGAICAFPLSHCLLNAGLHLHWDHIFFISLLNFVPHLFRKWYIPACVVKFCLSLPRCRSLKWPPAKRTRRRRRRRPRRVRMMQPQPLPKPQRLPKLLLLLPPPLQLLPRKPAHLLRPSQLRALKRRRLRRWFDLIWFLLRGECCEYVWWCLGSWKQNRLASLVVKASTSGAEGPGFESCLQRDFSWSSHTSDSKIGTSVATLPGAWRYRVSWDWSAWRQYTVTGWGRKFDPKLISQCDST